MQSQPDGRRDLCFHRIRDSSAATLLTLVFTCAAARSQSDSYASPATFIGGVAATPCDVQMSDLDGDGNADAVMGLRSHDPALARLDILLGMRRGHPSPFTGTPIEADAEDVRIGDVDGDAIPDLVVVTASAIVTRLGRGDATFEPAIISPWGLPFELDDVRLELADISGDAQLDVLATHTVPSPGVIVARGLGNGSFAPGQSSAIVSTDNWLLSDRPLVADFDLDGVADVLCPFINNDHAILALMPGIGNGQLGGQLNLLPEIPTVRCVVAMHLEGDPAVDLALGTINDVEVYRNLGGGAFAFATSVPDMPSDQLLAGDLDGDGHTDLVALRPPPTQNNAAKLGLELHVLRGDRGGGLIPIGTAIAVEAVSCALGDANADGHPDVAFADMSGETPRSSFGVLFGTGDGSLAGPSAVQVPQPYDVALVDLNGDGLLDMVVAEWSLKTVAFLAGLGNGSFAPPLVTPVSDWARAVRVADLDGDGARDVVVVTNNAFGGHSLVEALFGDGTGALTAGAVFDPGGVLAGLEVVDLDGDDRSEILTTSSAGVLTLRLVSRSAFAPPQLSPAFWSFSLLVRDFDGDSVADIILKGFMIGQGGIRLMHGLGDGTFAAPVLVVPNVGAYHFAQVVCGDFDADGHVDLGMFDGGDDSALDDVIMVAVGHGDGTFSAPHVTIANAKIGGLAAADINGDGFDDLVAAGNFCSTFAVFPSLGPAGFAPAQQFAADAHFKVAVADLNIDGRPDVVTFGSWLAATLLNTLTGHFAPLGGGSAGVHGTPRLTAWGTLLEDEAVTLHLFNARPVAPVVLAIGLHAAGLPLASGMLIPAPEVIAGGFVTSPIGDLKLEGRWPKGLPAGLNVYLQASVDDPAAADGAALSTALVGTTP